MIIVEREGTHRLADLAVSQGDRHEFHWSNDYWTVANLQGGHGPKISYLGDGILCMNLRTRILYCLSPDVKVRPVTLNVVWIPQ